MPTRFDNIVGNSALAQRLARDIDDGFLSHAYIIEGPVGSGRHTLAVSTAAAISCEKKHEEGKAAPCGKCKSCEKILSGKSPDVIHVGIEDDKVSLGIEAIRNLKNDIHIAPNDLDIKVYIIDNADRMTEQAQNALLLSLEEPPSYVIFFLICENSGSLLETIRSRAPSLRLERLSKSEIRKYLISHDKRAELLSDEAPAELSTLLHISNGCIGQALSLLDPKTRKAAFELRSTASKMISLLSGSSHTAAIEIIDAFGQKRNEVARQILCLQEALRDLIVLKKCESAPLCFFEDRDHASELSTHFTSKSLLSLYDATVRAIDELDANSNVRLTLINMMRRSGML